MSDEPVVVIDSENPVDFDIITDSVDFSFDETNPIDSDLGSSILIQNTDHAVLSNRDLPDQHPISAIENLQESLDAKQDNLVSGENIKTVGNETLLDSGNVQIIHAAVNGSEQLVLWLS